MVRKLMKHELYAFFRILVFIAAGVLVFAIIGRLLIAASFNGKGFGGPLEALFVLVILFYVFGIMALIAVAWGLSIGRFYKTLFGREGYMTFSLPATPTQIVTAKMLSAFVAMACASVVSVLSLLIFFIGWPADFMQEFLYALNEIGSIIQMAISEVPFLAVEYVLLMIVSLPMSLLVVYAIISVGQLFTARRVGLTWLIGFGVYFVANILNVTVLSPILELATEVSPHLAVWIEIILVAGIDVGCWFLIRYILKNKVNLIA